MKTPTALAAIALLVPGVLASTGSPLAAPTAPASQPEANALPSAEELFERHIEATGGMDAHKAITDRVLHGVYRILATGEEQVLTIYQAAPRGIRIEVDVPARGLNIRCSDGKDAWGLNFSGEPFLLPTKEVGPMLDDAMFYGEADYGERYESISTEQLVAIEGTPAYRVLFTSAHGTRGAVYFDVESGLIIGRETQDVNDLSLSNFIAISDYKEYEGVLLPMLTRQRTTRTPDYIVEIELRWIEINSGFTVDFAPPSDLERAELPQNEG